MNGASLFSNVREQVCQLLDIEDLDHRSVRNLHRETPLDATVGHALTKKVFEIVEANCRSLITEQSKKRSTKPGTDELSGNQNWRKLSPGTECDPKNMAREVGLERAIVAAFHQATPRREDWWNQVPVASGLYGSTAGKRRAIDLVHRRSATDFDFVELKLGSNTPPYAVVEILEYGFAWQLSKRHAGAMGYSEERVESTLLSARQVHLSVLAPAAFYSGSFYAAFAYGVDQALVELTESAEERLCFEGFKVFPERWTWTGDEDPSQLRTFVDTLYPV